MRKKKEKQKQIKTTTQSRMKNRKQFGKQKRIERSEKVSAVLAPSSDYI